MSYDQNPITFLMQLLLEFGSGDGTKSLKASGRTTCFATNNEGFGRNILRKTIEGY